MKVTITKRGWENWKMTKAQCERYLKENALVLAMINETKKNAEHDHELLENDETATIYDKPRRCTLTITYEVEDE